MYYSHHILRKGAPVQEIALTIADAQTDVHDRVAADRAVVAWETFRIQVAVVEVEIYDPIEAAVTQEPGDIAIRASVLTAAEQAEL